jgi:hypothetical protein
VEQLLAGVMFRISNKIATDKERETMVASGPQNS